MLDGWVMPSGSDFTIEVLNRSEIEVSFAISSETGSYQEGLSIAMSVDVAPRGSDRSGGTVYAVHKENNLYIGSFWYDPAAAENVDNPPVSGTAYVASNLYWTEVVSAPLDPAEDYEITFHGKYIDGFGENWELNDEVTITVRDSSGTVVETLNARSYEGRGASALGAAEDSEQASSKVMNGLTFYSGRNSASDKRTDGGQIFYPGEAVSPVGTTGFVISPLTVKVGSEPVPEPVSSSRCISSR